MGYSNNGTDRIYRIKFLNNTIQGELLHRGTLEFNANYPIDTLNYFENKDIQKVYWLDGKNQLRFLNKEDLNFTKWTDYKFDFIPKLELKEIFDISNNENAGGMFHSGIIQYAFTYFNMYGQESNIIYTSSLFNIGFKDRAGSPEEIVNCSFKIKISKLETKFDYIRIYSIQRASINDIPLVKKVIDIAIPKLDITDKEYNPIEFVDPGTIGEIVESTHLLYIGGDPIIPKTFSQKDNTLFLGNYSLKNNILGTLEIPKKNSSIKLPLYQLLFKANDYLTTSGLDNKATSSIDLSYKEMMADIVYNNYYSYTPDSLQNKKTTGTIGQYENFKTFKTNETYRLGVQFQHNTGIWSEPVYINDKTIDLLNLTEPVYWENTLSYVKYTGVKASVTLHDNNYRLIQTLVQNGYVKARPVIVYPNFLERRVVAQGVVNPTVFFCADRNSRDLYNVSSWFFRPMITKTQLSGDQIVTKELYPDATIYSTLTKHETAGVFNQFGTFAEWRHNRALPSCRIPHKSLVSGAPETTISMNQFSGSDVKLAGGYFNQEIQSLHDYRLLNAYTNYGFRRSDGSIIHSDNTINNLIGNYVNNYRDSAFIDQNIVTFHSPDVEFSTDFENINKEELIPKVVGYVNFTGYKAKKFINVIGGQLAQNAPGIVSTQNKKLNTETDEGLSVMTSGNINGRLGSNLMIVNPCYRDLQYSAGATNYYKTYPIYPWHAMDVTLGVDPSSEKAKLFYNKTSNLRYSAFTTYLTSIIDNNRRKQYYKSNPKDLCTLGAEGSRSETAQISSVELYNTDQFVPIKIKFDFNKLGEIYYQGNVDKLVNTKSELGYPILTYKTGTQTNVDDHDMYGHALLQQLYTVEGESKAPFSFQPCRIKFQSTPHLVFGLEPIEYSNDIYNITNQEKYTTQPILPCVNNQHSENNLFGVPFWDTKRWKIRQNSITVKYWNNVLEKYIDTEYGGLWMVELWRTEESIKTRFGDMPDRFGSYSPTQESLENLSWVPCGEAVSLVDIDGNWKSSITVEYTEGDTYLQRYDCLKTFGQNTDRQSITEILSFVCESHVMLDGRYDKFRNQTDSTLVTGDVFNKINPVYSQENNYFNYRTLNYNKTFSKEFPNTLIWSKAKTPGSLIDNWTNISLLSSMDVDGNLGAINCLTNLENKINGFQDKGIFVVNFNSRVQIQTSDNTPITIANNYKVDGVDYLTRTAGLINKWGINSESLNGAYFIDNLTRSIYNVNKLQNLSLSKGFHNWSRNNLENNNSWTPIAQSNFRIFYDAHEKDVYITNKDFSLCYSELNDCFTSFYSYNDVPYMFNINNKFIALAKDKSGTNPKYFLWENHKGNYNKFFNKNEGYHIVYNVNHIPTIDKTFDTVEFRSEAYELVNNIETLRVSPLFNKISVWNENQAGDKLLLTEDTYLPTKELIGRLKTWRSFIPRDKNTLLNVSTLNGYPYNKNRMRGTNMYLKLESDGVIENKNILHDVVVSMRI